MSLQTALNTALSGLNVSQAALATISNNIANANTPGYSRQVADQSAQILGTNGAGARIDAISRKVDKYLDRSIQRETSTVAAFEEIADYYQRIQILLGEPGSTNSVDEYMQSFFTSLQNLAEKPDRTSIQANVIDTAETLAREVSGLAAAMEDLRYQADQDIDEAVNAVNAQLSHLESLNIGLNRAVALDLSTASLLDERDKALEELSSYLDIEVYFEETGSVNVFTSNGVGLVDEAAFHELSYRPASGVDDFSEDVAMNPLQVLTYGNKNDTDPSTANIISGGKRGGITSTLRGGKIEGLRELRDELVPDILDQLDTLAAGLRDAINAVHNDGSGYPPASSLTGTRLVRADETFDWAGGAQITVLNADGSPIASPYDDEQHTGLRPMNLDFDFLNSGDGVGSTDVQTIIDEINNHFNAPPVKATLGNLNNIQLVANTNTLPSGLPTTFEFDLDLENIANFGTNAYVTNVTIDDDTGATIATKAGGEVTSTIPQAEIAGYDFTNGSNTVRVTTSGNHGFADGELVYLENPGGGPYGGGAIPSGILSGFFEVSVTGPDSFEVNLSTAAAADAVGVAPATAGISAMPPYHELEAGEKSRTRDSGTFTADLSANNSSEYFDITLTVAAHNQDPDATNANPIGTVTYRVFNNVTDLLNDRYDVRDTGIAAQRQFPGTPHQYVIARLVDENGREIPNTNGDYGSLSGYLQLQVNNINSSTDYRIAISEGDSEQRGKVTNTVVTEAGTGRGFSHYFELNNLFRSNEPNTTGDTLRGSALNLEIEERLLEDPSLISTGQVEPTNPPADPDDPRQYTFERHIGNNSVAQRLAEVGFERLQFEAAGGLPDSVQNLNGYVGEILGFVATKTVRAEQNYSDANSLLEGLVQRADAISGVNLDEELANTTLYQQAYAASARVISVADELFDALVAAFN